MIYSNASCIIRTILQKPYSEALLIERYHLQSSNYYNTRSWNMKLKFKRYSPTSLYAETETKFHFKYPLKGMLERTKGKEKLMLDRTKCRVSKILTEQSWS